MDYKSNKKPRIIEKISFEPGEKNWQIKNIYTKNNIKEYPDSKYYRTLQDEENEKAVIRRENPDFNEKQVLEEFNKRKKERERKARQIKNSFRKDVKNFNAMRMNINSKIYNQLHEKNDENER